MRILLATDGSPHSDAALIEVYGRPWPEGSELKIVSVPHQIAPAFIDPYYSGYAAHEEALEDERNRSRKILDAAESIVREKAPTLAVSTELLAGSPKQVIVEEAVRWHADLVVVGSHGYGTLTSFLLGSVSHAVALHAPCSVEIVRKPDATSEVKQLTQEPGGD